MKISYLADSQLTRKAPASYADGVYKMSGNSRPSPRAISQKLLKGSDGLPSRRNRTALHTFFGKSSSKSLSNIKMGRTSLLYHHVAGRSKDN